MRIIGAGMAGLLAARMLSPKLKPHILEKASALPHNHSAVLRFATTKVADVLGIPFKRVQLIKTVVPWKNPVADALAYSNKVLGEYRSDRSVLLPERWQSIERYIAPENLIEQMADGLAIEFGCDYDFPHDGEKVISTIPMPILAVKLGYPKDLGWKWVKGRNIVARLKNCEAYVSVMVPSPNVPFYRVSITGSQLIIELSKAGASHKPDDVIDRACEMIGVRQDSFDFETIDQTYAKIAPIEEDDRRMFIHWASTQTGRAWQLGRFATWRPKLLLDDLVQDVRKIERWIGMPSGYEQDLELVKDRRDETSLPGIL